MLDGWDKDWRHFTSHLKSFSGIVTPEATLEAIAQTSDEAERRVWQTLEDVAAIATPMELTASAIRRASEIREFLGLSAGDAIVLSLVVSASEAGQCRDFLSRDEDFRKSDVVAYIWRTKGSPSGVAARHFSNP